MPLTPNPRTRAPTNDEHNPSRNIKRHKLRAGVGGPCSHQYNSIKCSKKQKPSPPPFNPAGTGMPRRDRHGGGKEEFQPVAQTIRRTCHSADRQLGWSANVRVVHAGQYFWKTVCCKDAFVKALPGKFWKKGQYPEKEGDRISKGLPNREPPHRSPLPAVSEKFGFQLFHINFLKTNLICQYHYPGLNDPKTGDDEVQPSPPTARPPTAQAGQPRPRPVRAPRRRVKPWPLVPTVSYVGPPDNGTVAKLRIQVRLRRLAAKDRLDNLFERIRDANPEVRVTRALFDRRIKDLVGEQSRAELGINLDAIPAADSSEEYLVLCQYALARDVALCAKRRQITDRDIEVAIKHLRVA
ncbi:hypothetical protein HNY73_013453 [Argiope bruennichi]|uniref:Uncharacterized protein n=1 Tax=Argiope bruennichi TaxID=94029 RepID=A0A8T0F2X1_ARGBR|nr:hypothetical protein HNY73_013453 [Argiope bruennichi]